MTFHILLPLQGPEVVVDEPSLNFGLVRLGDTAEKELTLTNKAQIITKWSLQDKPMRLDLEPDDDMVHCLQSFTNVVASL